VKASKILKITQQVVESQVQDLVKEQIYIMNRFLGELSQKGYQK